MSDPFSEFGEPFWVAEIVSGIIDKQSNCKIAYLGTTDRDWYSGSYLPSWDCKTGYKQYRFGIDQPVDAKQRTFHEADAETAGFGPLTFEKWTTVWQDSSIVPKEK